MNAIINSLNHQFGSYRDEYLGAAEEAQQKPTTPYSLRRPSEILAMEFDPADNLLGDFLLSRGASLAILGQGGVGKSFLVLQLAVHSILTRLFLGLTTRGRNLKWLILQTENNNRRLQFDLQKLKSYIGADDWERVDQNLVIHTLEVDQDHSMGLADPENLLRMEAAISQIQPDVVVIDPLKDFAIGDLNKDVDMAETCRMISSIVKKGNQNRAVVVLHHALTGSNGAAKASGFDRASFSRNSKVLHSWARAVINVAAGTEDYSKLVVACGKNNNGKEFSTFAVKRDPESLIFSVDPEFDLEAWDTEVGGKKRVKKKPTADQVKDVLGLQSLAKGELVQALMAELGCQKTKAYEAIADAQKTGAVNYDAEAKRFSITS